MNLIDYYEGLSIKCLSDPTDERALFYDFLELLAARQYSDLRSNRVIERDRDIDRAFELGTAYLFEKKLGLTLLEIPGSDRPDGGVQASSSEIVLWDNKSCETPYVFPEEHLQQFLRYIRSSTKDVTLFLVVAPDFDSPAETQAQKLKAFSDEDTDVALITARDLKYMAEHWQEYSNQKSPSFSPSVLDLTGLLTRDLLIERLGWLVR